MKVSKDIFLMIKDAVKSSDPGATVILYGSFARGDNRHDSDVDLLILLDKEKVTRADEKKSNTHCMTLSLIQGVS